MQKKSFTLSQGFLNEISKEFSADFFSRSSEDLEVFGKDWTRVFVPQPSGVCFPRSTLEVSRFLIICSKWGVAVVPSGGRTGLAGGAVAAHGEVVLSLSRMTHMDAVDPLAQTVRVQAGAITQGVHLHTALQGLTWPIDFASKGSSHIGGNIATNAGGVKVIRYGLTRNWVLGLQVVTMKGEILELNGALEKNNTGVDLKQLFIGSEGTLGVITEAVLKLTRLPGPVDVFFFALESTAAVFQLFQEARRASFQITAFEFLTEKCFQLVSQSRGIQSPFKNSSSVYVLLEIERPAHPDAQKTLDDWLEKLFVQELVLDGTLAQSPREAKDLWSLREGISESLAQKGFVHKNDIALPIAQLEKFLEEFYRLFSEKNLTSEVYVFGHIGDGNLHVNTLKPKEVDQEVFIQSCLKMDQNLFEVIRKYRGSISAEHGIGLLKKKFLQFSKSPAELELMRNLKKIFDPQGLMNPGKILD